MTGQKKSVRNLSVSAIRQFVKRIDHQIFGKPVFGPSQFFAELLANFSDPVSAGLEPGFEFRHPVVGGLNVLEKEI